MDSRAFNDETGISLDTIAQVGSRAELLGGAFLSEAYAERGLAYLEA